MLRNLQRERAGRRVQVTVSDYRSWLRTQSAGDYDAVVSSEFLPELNRAETHSFLQECYRILLPRGIVINSFLSPIPRNNRQRLLVEADSNPKWTKDPPKEWFSPTCEFVAKSLRQAGFSRVKTGRLKTGLIVRADAARSLLKSWDVRPSFWNRHRPVLEKQGLELPDSIITTANKPVLGN